MELYISQQKSQLLDSLETQVRFSQLVAVIIGSKGLGKTFLLEQLHQRLTDDVVIANIDASYAMTEEQLDKTISLQLGLSWQDSVTSLEQRISSTHSQKVFISIDDAHHLSSNCLEYLLKLNQSQLADQESTLFVMLAGEKSLANAISQSNIYAQHPEMCVVFELEPIHRDETRSIVDCFSHPNSEMLNELKDTNKLDYFWQLSKGNPAELNYHMSRWLDDHSPTQVVEISTNNHTTYLKSVIYGLLVLVLMSMLIYQDEINNWISPPEKTLPQSEVVNGETKKDPSKTILDKETKPVQMNTIKDAKPKNASLLIEERQQVTTDKSEQEVVLPTIDEKNNRKSKLDEKASSQNSPPEKLTETLTLLSDDEQALLELNGDYLALQWLGLSSLKSAEEYRSNHIGKVQMRIYRRISSNKTLYLIVSDEFSNRALAEFAKNDYIQKGAREKPWVKSIAAIQKEINEFRTSK